MLEGWSSRVLYDKFVIQWLNFGILFLVTGNISQDIFNQTRLSKREKLQQRKKTNSLWAILNKWEPKLIIESFIFLLLWKKGRKQSEVAGVIFNGNDIVVRMKLKKSLNSSILST